MKYAHVEKYKVRNHEIEASQEMTIPSILLVMQDASMINAEQLKLTIWDMAERNVSWVLLRKKLTIFNLPKRGDRIKVLTYPAGFDRVFAYRDFKLFSESNGDGEDQLLAQASSTWTLMNMTSRKMERIPESFYQFSPDDTTQCLTTPPNKIPGISQIHLSKSHEVVHYDLDWNGHMNNVILTKLFLQSMPPSWLGKTNLEEYTIHIKSECLLDEKLNVNFQEVSSTETRHQILGESDRLVAMAVAKWRNLS